MGPLFVLIMWAILGWFLAVGAGSLAFVLNLRSPRALQVKRVVFAVVLPFFAIGWTGCSVVSFAIWSSATGMHLGFGNFADFSEVPLTNGYSVWMIDTTHNASIHRGSSNESLVRGVLEIGQWQNVVFGRTDHGFFILDTVVDDVRQGLDEPEYLNDLKSRGIRAANLTAVGHFYAGRRWNPLDSGVVAIQVVSPVLLIIFVWRRFMRSSKSGAAEQPTAAVGGTHVGG
jgi:hypothetical protein